MIKVFKLVTGEDIIGDVSDNVGVMGKKILESPAQIIIQPTPQGMSVGLVPYMPYAKKGVSIYIAEAAVVASSDPDIELENEYRRIFGSGLVVARAGSVG